MTQENQSSFNETSNLRQVLYNVMSEGPQQETSSNTSSQANYDIELWDLLNSIDTSTSNLVYKLCCGKCKLLNSFTKVVDCLI